MNTTEIISMCKEIYRDYCGMGRVRKDMDSLMLNCIIRQYNMTVELDWEEVKWLWVKYLEDGNLYFSDAMEMARKRIRKERYEARYVICFED